MKTCCVVMVNARADVEKLARPDALVTLVTRRVYNRSPSLIRIRCPLTIQSHSQSSGVQSNWSFDQDSRFFPFKLSSLD
jgi:hypothetical protein